MPAVGYVAEQLEALPAVRFDYPPKGRSGSRDREQLRAFLGFRQATVDDMEPIRLWLSQDVVPQDQDPRHLRSAVLDWCRCPAGRTRGASPPYASPFVRILPCQPGLRPEADPGLPRAPRPRAHGSLHAGRWCAVRGHVGDVRQVRGQRRGVNLALHDSYVVSAPT